MVAVELVKELRERTGCGIVDCREALAETANDIERAIQVLRAKGKVKAAKKASRAAGEGIIVSYVHGNDKLGVLVALACETDFVARTDQFSALAKDIALHIAASDPLVVNPDEVPSDVIAAEEAVALKQAAASQKPAAIQKKMIAGKLARARAERALLTQPFVKDPTKTVNDRINEAIQELGEKITVRQFSRVAI